VEGEKWGETGGGVGSGRKGCGVNKRRKERSEEKGDKGAGGGEKRKHTGNGW